MPTHYAFDDDGSPDFAADEDYGVCEICGNWMDYFGCATPDCPENFQAENVADCDTIIEKDS